MVMVGALTSTIGEWVGERPDHTKRHHHHYQGRHCFLFPSALGRPAVALGPGGPPEGVRGNSGGVGDNNNNDDDDDVGGGGSGDLAC